MNGGVINSGQGSSSISVTWGAAGSANLAVTDSNAVTGCATTTGAYAVTIGANPTPMVSGPSVTCQNQIATYSTPFNTGNAYVWNVSNGTILSGLGTNSITVQWSNLGAGDVTVTDSVLIGGCRTTTPAYSVQTYANPTPVISGEVSICENNLATYTTPANAGRSYQWSVSGGTINSGQGTNSIVVLWGSAGAGSVIVTDSVDVTGCKTTTAPYGVTINAYPTPVITGNGTVCTGASANYSITANPGRTYVWDVVGGSISAGQNTTSIEVVWGAAGVGSVTVSDSVNATGCKTTTAPYPVVITPAISNNTVSNAQTICSGSTPTVFNGSTPTNGNGAYTYAWESSTTSATSGFTAAAGSANLINYQSPTVLTSTTWYRRVVSSGDCASNASTAIEITVTPVISNNTINGATTICTGNTPSTFTGTTPAGGNGPISYLWESSTTSATAGFANAAGVNQNASYDAGVLTQTTWFRRVVSSGDCAPLVSNVIEITVNPLVSNNNLNTPSQVCIGTATADITGTTPIGGNSSFSYTWESSTTSATAGFAPASGVNNDETYSPGMLSQTTWFRRIATAGVCPSNTSVAVIAQVNEYPTPVVSGLNAICENNSTSYSIPSNTGRAYTWQVIGGTITSGQGSTSINVNWGAAGTGQVIATDSVLATGCATTTAPYLVTKNAYPTPVISGSNTVCSFSSTSFSVPSNANRAYQWQVTGGVIASGQGTSSITVAWGAPGPGTVIVTDSNTLTSCATTTSAFSVSINNSPSPVISGVNSICENNQAIYSTPFNAGSAYLWQISGGTIVGGLGTNSITVNWNTVGNGSLVVTDSILAGGCKTATSPYIVAVNAYPTPVISGLNTVCIQSSQTYSIAANPGRAYNWVVNGGVITNGQGTATIDVLWNTAGANTVTVTDSVVATGCATTTTPFNVNVNPFIASNTISGNQTICTGNAPSILVGSTPTGGNGTYIFEWLSSTTSAIDGFSPAIGTNDGRSYTSGPLSQTTWFKRVVSAGVCSSDTSTIVMVTVNPLIVNNTIGSDQTICHNTIPTALSGSIASGGNGTISYTWESSTTSASAGFTTAAGTSNAQNYTPGSLAATTWFRRVVSAGVCPANVSSAVKITVQDTTKPRVVVRNVTKVLDANGSASITLSDIDNGSSDNCGIASRVLSQTSFNCTNVGINNVYLVVTDLIGNKDSALALVTIQDNTRPTVIVKNHSAYLDASGNATITVANINNGSFDNCTIASSVLSKTSFNCTNMGANTVKLVVTDSNGNKDSAEATVTVLDTIKPTVNVNTGIVLYLNASASISITNALINNGSFDNCGIASMTVSPSTINCTHIGITPITLTVTDVNGNVNTAVTNVVVFDPVAPVARPKAKVIAYLSTSGSAVVNTADLDSASTDNCTITSRIVSQSTFNCSHLGNNNILFTVQDQSGNSHAANLVVEVRDTIKPIAVVQNVTATLNNNGQVTVTAAQVNNGSSDNCGNTTFTLSKTSFDCTNLGANDVVLTVTDGSGNNTRANATITVVDNTAPVARPRNLTVYLNASGNATITAAQADSASTDNCGINNRSVSMTSFSCSNIGNNSVSLTVSDVSNNSHTASFNVLVLDTIRPIAVAQNRTIYLGSAGTASITAAMVDNASSDNCGTVNLSLSQTSFTCANVGSNTVTLTATDASGNFRTATATITVMDTIKPTLSVNSSITLYLNTTGNATLTTAMVNNGSTDNCSISSVNLSQTSFSCAQSGSNNVLFTVTDVNGNSNSANISVNIIDSVKPVARPRNLTLFLNASGTVSLTAAQADSASTDNCGIVSRAISKTSFDCSNVGNNTLSLTITDASSNSHQVSFNVNVRDTVRPVAIAQNLTAYLGSNGTVSITPAMVNNGSSDNCGTVSLGLTQTNFTCANLGSSPVTLTVTDASGNFRTATATITVLDTIRPVVNVNNSIILYLGATGSASLTTAMVNNGSTDNCSIANLSLSQTSFTCANRGNNSVNFTVTDASNNSRTVAINVTIADTTRPVARPRNMTVYLSATGLATITAAQADSASSDNCGVSSRILSNTVFDCSNLGNNSVGLTIADATGNSHTANFNVLVLDTVRPLAIAQNATVYIGTNGLASISVALINNNSSDNCGGVSLSLNQSNFNCANLGSNPVILTVTDASGNFRTATATVTVLDTVKPTLQINGVVNLYLNAAGSATLTTAMVNNGSSDNCGIVNTTLSKTTFGSADLGSNLVTFTAFDASGNNRSANFSVVVIDTVRPVVNVQNVTAYLNSTGTATVTAAQVNNGSTDNVNIASLVLSQTAFNCSDIGLNNVTLTVTDNSGNFRTANAVVTIIDSIKPLLTPANITVYLNALGTASINASQVTGSATDNCGTPNLSINNSVFTCGQLGANQVTITATDASNNNRTAVATVTVLDTIRPIAIVNSTVNLYLNNAGLATLTTAMVNNGSTDNCAISGLTLSKTNFTGADLGANSVLFTLTDASNNSRAVNITVNVIDSVRPIAIAQNVTTYINATGTASITAAMVNNGSSDNVGVANISLSQTNFTCSNLGANTVTLTVSDASGNFRTASATVTVLDTIRPIATANNLTVYLNAIGNATITNTMVNAGATDNCGVASVSLSKSSFDCANLGINNITMSVADASGNIRNVNAVITVLDTIRPVASINNTISLYLNASGTATLTTAMVNNGSSDNCAISNLSLSKTSFTGADLGLNLVNFTITDNSSNSRTVGLTVNVMDTIRPIAIAQNRTIYLDATGNATVTAAQVNNGSTDNVGVTGLSISKGNFNCDDLGANQITFSAFDVSGNSRTVNVNITVLDTIKPTMAARNLTVYLNANGVASITEAMANNGSADNCGTLTLSLSKAGFDCTNLGVNNITLSGTDASNNVSVANLTVTVLDTLKPINVVNNNYNLYLDATGNATLAASDIDAGSTDNCGISSRVISKTSFNATNLGINQITFTTTDASGNFKITNVTVVVRDSMVPIIRGKDITIYLGNNGSASLTASMVDNGSTDNVAIISRSITKSFFNCQETGVNPIVFTIRDASGNEANTLVNVTVADTSKPILVFQPKDIAVGFCNDRVVYNAPTASDNCASVTVTQTGGLPSGAIFPVGATVNSFDLTDPSGNKVSYSFTVVVIPETVIDTFPDVEICADNSAIDFSKGFANLTFSGTGIAKDKKTFDPALSGSGNFLITAMFLDSMGCVSTGTFNVVVNRVPEKPVIVRLSASQLGADQVYDFYQWYRNNQPISGANSRTYNVSQSGVYGLVVRNNSGCVNGSDPFALGVALGGNTIIKDKDLFNVYPNPTAAKFYIELKGISSKGTAVTIMDVTGKEVQTFEAFSDIMEMDSYNFAAGTYYVRISNGERILVKPIVIVK